MSKCKHENVEWKSAVEFPEHPGEFIIKGFCKDCRQMVYSLLSKHPELKIKKVKNS